MGALIDMIGSLFDLIWGFILDLIYAVSLAGKVIISIPQYIGWIPSVSIITIVLGLVIVYKVLGREG